MRVLIDTHALLWWLAGDTQLPVRMRRVIDEESNVVVVSAATAWEITTKFRLGKLPGAREIAADVLGTILGHGFYPLDISMAQAQRSGALPGPHRDPFDRMLIAQALDENIPIISNETIFDAYKIERMWE